MKQEMALFNVAQPDGKIKLDFDDWEVGYNCGILVKPFKSTRVGIMYRSEIKHTLEGDVDISGQGPGWTLAGLQDTYAETSISNPQNIMVSVYQQLSKKFAVLLDAGWQDWSSFDKSVITTESGTAVTLNRDWTDTWRLGFGLHYQVAERLLLRTGMSYDSDPSSLANRTSDVAMNQQWRYALGCEYALKENMDIGVNWEWMDSGSTAIDKQVGAIPRLAGDHCVFGNFVGLSFRWRFGASDAAPEL
jgi:long-chain fatty acid transport protein